MWKTKKKFLKISVNVLFYNGSLELGGLKIINGDPMVAKVVWSLSYEIVFMPPKNYWFK